MSHTCSCGQDGPHPAPEPRHVQYRRDKVSYQVSQSSFTKRFGYVCGWTGDPRQGEIVGSGFGEAQNLYQFQGGRWVLVWGEATDPDPTDPGSPWPAPVPAVEPPSDTWIPGDPAREMWMRRLFEEGTT